MPTLAPRRSGTPDKSRPGHDCHTNIPAFCPLKSDALDVRVCALENYITLLCYTLNRQHHELRNVSDGIWSSKQADPKLTYVDEGKGVSAQARQDAKAMDWLDSTSHEHEENICSEECGSVIPSEVAIATGTTPNEKDLEQMDRARLQDLNPIDSAQSQDWNPIDSSRSIRRNHVSQPGSTSVTKIVTKTDIPWKECELAGSVWDALLFVRMDIMYATDDLIMIVLALVNFMFQSLFISLVQTNFVTGDFSTREIVRQMQDWRMAYAHDPRYADGISSTPLAKLVCTGSPLIMEGAQLAIRVQGIDDYLRLNFGFYSGSLLCMLANVLWIFTCIREGDRCRQFLFGVWLRVYDSGDADLAGLQRCLSASSCVFTKISKRVSWTIEGEDTSTSLDLNLSFARGALLTAFVFVPRAVVLVFLAFTGTQFLVTTFELRELILNAVALEVILTIDEMMYALFAPEVVQTTLDKMLPLRLPRAPFVLTMASPWLKLGFVAGMLALVRYGNLFLEPWITNMFDARTVMCSGSLDFLAFETAFGPVAAGVAQEATVINRSSYAYRAILQRTSLQGPCFPACLYLDSDQKDAPFPIQSAAHAGQLRNLFVRDIANAKTGDGSYAVGCAVDLGWARMFAPPANDAIFEAIKEKVHDPRASSCAYLKANGWCVANSIGGANARFFCPNTCGCNDPVSGNPYRDAQHGVPADCGRMIGVALINMRCEDTNISMAPSAFASAANGYLRILFSTLGKLAGGNATHRQASARIILEFGKYGCPWLVQWDHPAKYIHSFTGVSHNIPAFLCSVAQMSNIANIRSARYLCPITCGCTTKLVQVAPGMQFVSVASRYQGTNWTTSIGVTSNCPKQCFET